MRAIVIFSLFLKCSVILGSSQKESLYVYGEVPGLQPSPYYKIQVRTVGAEYWLDPFTFLTECTGEKFCNTTGMFKPLHEWSNSYINFEMEEGTDVEIKITKLFEDPVTKAVVTKAVVHPKTSAKSCEIKKGAVHIVINKPVLFTVDINGQMDDQDTGKLPHARGYYDGPPIHTVTIFANPVISRPSLDDPGGIFSFAD